jgi:putative endonuclease
MPRWYTYILQCSDQSFYTGSTTDLNRRLQEHQTGQGARYTHSRRPVNLVWSQSALSRPKAQQREARIKACTRTQKEQLIQTSAKLR